MLGHQFYPTPQSLSRKAIEKIDLKGVNSILDPEAGKGDFLKAVNDCRRSYGTKFSAIEIDENLQKLIPQEYKLIDSDFLEYAGGDQFDLIVMNPPFDNGDKHLLKAIDIMFSGQIVCILNAETIRNPYSNIRKHLVSKLKELDADIEYVKDAFKEAERTTDVEVALIYIDMRKEFEDIFPSDMDVADEYSIDDTDDNNSIALKDDIHAEVARYNHIRDVGVKTIIDFYRNHKYIGEYITINSEKYESSCDVNGLAKKKVNDFICDLRERSWKNVSRLKSVSENMTQSKRDEFNASLNKRSEMDFTVKNIRSFTLSLAETFQLTLKDSAVKLFDEMTRDSAYYPEMKKNILHFDGWKTNNAYKVGKKVILPGFDIGPWHSWNSLGYRAEGKLNDIDKVMSYFTGNVNYDSIVDTMRSAFKDGESKNIKSTHFTMNVYQKGTIHFVFNDLDVLRRFNLFVCKDKNWLPHDYGRKKYDDMKEDEKNVVKEFDGIKNYKYNPVVVNDMLMIEGE